jgi:hypothetical protein
MEFYDQCNAYQMFAALVLGVKVFEEEDSNVLTQRCLLNPIELMLDLSVDTCALFQAPTYCTRTKE